LPTFRLPPFIMQARDEHHSFSRFTEATSLASSWPFGEKAGKNKTPRTIAAGKPLEEKQPLPARQGPHFPADSSRPEKNRSAPMGRRRRRVHERGESLRAALPRAAREKTNHRVRYKMRPREKSGLARPTNKAEPCITPRRGETNINPPPTTTSPPR